MGVCVPFLAHRCPVSAKIYHTKSRGLREISRSEIYHRKSDLARNPPPPLCMFALRGGNPPPVDRWVGCPPLGVKGAGSKGGGAKTESNDHNGRSLLAHPKGILHSCVGGWVAPPLGWG